MPAGSTLAAQLQAKGRSAPIKAELKRIRLQKLNATMLARRERKAVIEAESGPKKRTPRQRIKRRKALVKWADPRLHDAWWYLKPRERAFVQNIVSGMQYKEAYLAAGFSGGSYTDVMKRRIVRSALYQKVKEVEREGDISAGQWLREVSHLAFMPGTMLNGPPSWDHKLKAMEMMARYQKWLVENVNVRAEIGIAHLFGAATQATMKNALIAVQTIDTALEHQGSDQLVTDMSATVLEHATTDSET